MIQYNHIVAISQQDVYNKMKLAEDLKSVRYIRDHIDLVDNNDGFVILPAWQFALFVTEYESQRRNNIMWFGMFVLMAAWCIIYSMM